MKNAKIITPKIENPNARRKPMVFKVNQEEEARIQARADELSDGNLSAYLRHAALHYEDKK